MFLISALAGGAYIYFVTQSPETPLDSDDDRSASVAAAVREDPSDEADADTAEDSQPGEAASTNAATGKLSIVWPPEQRSGGTLTINGGPYRVPATGPIEIPLRSGQYEIGMVQGSGARAVGSVTLAAGSRERFIPDWLPASGPTDEHDSEGFIPGADFVQVDQPSDDDKPQDPNDAVASSPGSTTTGASSPAGTPASDSPASDQPASDSLASDPEAPSPSDDGPEDTDIANADATTDIEQRLLGKTATLLFWNGTSVVDAEIVGVEPGSAEDTLTALAIVPPKGARGGGVERKVRVKPLARIVLGKQVYEIRQQDRGTDYRLFDVNAHLAKVDIALRREGHMLWPELNEKQQTAIIAEQKEFLDKVGQSFTGMRLYETKYFLFYTDIPAQQVEFFVNCLDKMYDELCKIFGVTGGENIWKGKAVVLAFANEGAYHLFEAKVMGNPSSVGSVGLHHGFSDGRVIISVFAVDDPKEFAHTLVHETAHGFVHRYKSNVHIVSWINEGIAEWVANRAVPQGNNAKLRVAVVRQRLAQTGSLGGNFFSETQNIDGWQYGVAYQMTDLMIGAAPMKYGQFIDGIKEGKSVEQSLQDTFAMNFLQLVQAYSAAIRMPVRP
jgi:hypothetical protein